VKWLIISFLGVIWLAALVLLCAPLYCSGIGFVKLGRGMSVAAFWISDSLQRAGQKLDNRMT
jgi:hypothetical protein